MKESESLHFTGTIWRPPFEARSVLLQVTVGCTHHACKFCSLYGDLRFRISPAEEVEADLRSSPAISRGPGGFFSSAPTPSC